MRLSPQDLDALHNARLDQEDRPWMGLVATTPSPNQLLPKEEFNDRMMKTRPGLRRHIPMADEMNGGGFND